MTVEIRNLQRRVRLFPRRLRRTAARALAALGRPGAEVHLTVADDALIRRLHARHLGRRRATDVLAFPLDAPGPPAIRERPGAWGEIVISAETARRHAGRLRVPVALEIDLLVVHGLLHLAGYDDGDPREAGLMHGRAREILEGHRRAVPARLWQGLLSA
jgi:probable rRNA maturation factor